MRVLPGYVMVVPLRRMRWSQSVKHKGSFRCRCCCCCWWCWWCWCWWCGWKWWGCSGWKVKWCPSPNSGSSTTADLSKRDLPAERLLWKGFRLLYGPRCCRHIFGAHGPSSAGCISPSIPGQVSQRGGRAGGWMCGSGSVLWWCWCDRQLMTGGGSDPSLSGSVSLIHTDEGWANLLTSRRSNPQSGAPTLSLFQRGIQAGLVRRCLPPL